MSMKDTRGKNGSAPSVEAPDPELMERAQRRRFKAEYKLRVLREADACTKPGEIGCDLWHLDHLSGSRSTVRQK